ncbi:MAG: UDP-N-acetylmuramoyl-L-alanyl-D-glutamate--2,6-diaminopimelate ligase [bacterium]
MLIQDIFLKTNIYSEIENISIDHISCDSRNVIKNTLFVAYKGVESDGHDYINDAISKGATVIVGTEDFSKIENNGTLHEFKDYKKDFPVYIQVKNGRIAWAQICANWFGRPQDKLKFIGITGTDGKTTTCNMIYSVLKEAGLNVAILSTINSPGLHVTTPDAFNLHKFLLEFVNNDYEWVILETTSHALAYNNVFGITYEFSGLTNISPEHLDFHKSFENYINAKTKLFLQSKHCILPNNETGKIVSDKLKYIRSHTIIDFPDGESNNSEYFSSSIFPDSIDVIFYNKNNCPTDINLSMPGEHFLYDAAIASVIANNLGINNKIIKIGLEKVKDLKGRWEITFDKNFTIIVDHSHTPNAISSALEASRQYMEKKRLKGRLIHIFGSAGERDAVKRVNMGISSAKFADISIITSEDPRREEIKNINIEIEKGLISLGFVESKDFGNIKNKTYYDIPWRGSAISFAINKILQAGDLLLVTGKGHEESMCFGTIEYPWTDQECINKNLQLLNIA